MLACFCLYLFDKIAWSRICFGTVSSKLHLCRPPWLSQSSYFQRWSYPGMLLQNRHGPCIFHARLRISIFGCLSVTSICLSWFVALLSEWWHSSLRSDHVKCTGWSSPGLSIRDPPLLRLSEVYLERNHHNIRHAHNQSRSFVWSQIWFLTHCPRFSSRFNQGLLSASHV